MWVMVPLTEVVKMGILKTRETGSVSVWEEEVYQVTGSRQTHYEEPSRHPCRDVRYENK